MLCNVLALREFWGTRKQLNQIYGTRGHKNGEVKMDKGAVHGNLHDKYPIKSLAPLHNHEMTQFPMKLMALMPC